MRPTIRSTALNVGALVAGIADAFLLLLTVSSMTAALDGTFGKWPHFWWLGVLLSLVSCALALVWIMTIVAAGDPSAESTSGHLRRALVYLLIPLVVSAVVSIVALAATAILLGSLF